MKEYELTQEDVAAIKEASKSVPYLVAGGTEPVSPYDRAMAVWRQIGERMGFDYNTVAPVRSKGERFIIAVPLPPAPTQDKP